MAVKVTSFLEGHPIARSLMYFIISSEIAKPAISVNKWYFINPTFSGALNALRTTFLESRRVCLLNVFP
jgi:hypothetical protein